MTSVLAPDANHLALAAWFVAVGFCVAWWGAGLVWLCCT